MPAPDQELRKNYIGVRSDRIEEQRAVEAPAKSGHPMKQYLLGLMAAVLNRHGNAP